LLTEKLIDLDSQVTFNGQTTDESELRTIFLPCDAYASAYMRSSCVWPSVTSWCSTETDNHWITQKRRTVVQRL